MTLRLFKREVRISTFRESVPTDPTVFQVARAQTSTEITDLRVRFKVEKTLTKHPNSGDVIITNLSPSTRADMERKPLLCRVHAGYDGVLKLLYEGDVRFAMTKLEVPDWETLLQLGDGDCMHRWARINRSYQEGTPVRKIVSDAAGTMGFRLPAELAADPRLDERVPVGRALAGPTRDELTRLLAPYGYSWSIQNGQFQVLADSGARSEAPLLISEDTGMIGTPVFGSPPRTGKPPHVTVKCHLYPEILPGGRVELRSLVKSGVFRAEKVTHKGDTHGSDWETEIELKPI